MLAFQVQCPTHITKVHALGQKETRPVFVEVIVMGAKENCRTEREGESRPNTYETSKELCME